MSLEVKTVRKGKKKENVVKKILLSMKVGEAIELSHKEYYCHGSRNACSIAHYIFQLKESGKGKWSIEHLAQGIAKITRTN